MNTIIGLLIAILIVFLYFVYLVHKWYSIQLDIIQQFFNRQDDKFMEYFKQLSLILEKHIESTKEAHNITTKQIYIFPHFKDAFIPNVGKVIKSNPLSSLWYLIKITFKR